MTVFGVVSTSTTARSPKRPTIADAVRDNLGLGPSLMADAKFLINDILNSHGCFQCLKKDFDLFSFSGTSDHCF